MLVWVPGNTVKHFGDGGQVVDGGPMALLEFVGGPWDGDFMGWTDPPPSEIRIPMADRAFLKAGSSPAALELGARRLADQPEIWYGVYRAVQGGSTNPRDYRWEG